MTKDDLKCVLIGRDINIYNGLARIVRKIDPTSRFKQVELDQMEIVATLKKISGPSLIFISDEVPFSLELLSDLTWQYNPDAIVVIVTFKAQTISIKELFNYTQFSRINLHKKNPYRVSILQFLIQFARQKADIRHCKSLLGVSEKRCQWLVNSSREAISFISRDMHWYANAAYLQLFGISSIQELRSITVKDVIIPDEHLLFDSFQKNQGKALGEKRSIMLSMSRLNGSTFRASVYLIPCVFKGQKCYQLWVRKVNSLSSTKDENKEPLNKSKSFEVLASEPKIVKVAKKEDANPFSGLLNKDTEAKQSIVEIIDFDGVQGSNEVIDRKKSRHLPFNKRNYGQTSLLKGIIRRKEARLIGTQLKYLQESKRYNKKTLKHKMVSLKVATAQKKGVDDLLIKLPESFNQPMRSVFWDKVKFSRVLQILVKKEKLSINLLLQVNEASILDDSFVDWLIPGLKRLGNKSQNLILLIPSNINENQYKQTLTFIKKVKKYKCKIALDSFAINKESIVLLKYSKPQYIRLSLPWTRQLEGSELKELQLSSVIRQLENKNIKVIAPCNFSKGMRRLFVLSGASFCQ